MAYTRSTETLEGIFADLDQTGVVNTYTELRALLRRILQSKDLDVINSGSDGTAIAFADTQLTAAQFNALAATNITLVAAPGAGLAVVPFAVHLFLDFGSAAFVQAAATDQLALRYSASNEIAEIGTQAQCEAFIEAAADAELYSPIPAIAGGFVPEVNKAVVLDNNGAAEYTTGTGSTVSIRVFYRVVPMAAFT